MSKLLMRLVVVLLQLGLVGCTRYGFNYHDVPISSRDASAFDSASADVRWRDGGAPDVTLNQRRDAAQGDLGAEVDMSAQSDAATVPQVLTVLPALEAARTQPLGAWTGNDFLVWGGRDARYGHCGQASTSLGDGARYSFATNRWLPMAAVGAPAPRFDSAPLVWTGDQLITWGACTFWLEGHADGARYSPATDGWSAVSSAGAPGQRGYHTAVWTGSHMVVWGGHNGSFDAPLADGAAYDPARDSWQRLSDAGAPRSRHHHSGVWTGTQLIVWGGQTTWNADNSLDTGGRFTPQPSFADGSWQATSLQDAPSPRTGHSAIWTGEEMVIWGGRRKVSAVAGGAAYNPAADSWRALSQVGAPPASYGHAALWTGTQMLVFGGCCSPTEHYYLYHPGRDEWTVSTLTSPLLQRYAMAAAWVGQGFIFAGGNAPEDVTSLLSDGAYVPVSAGTE